MLPWTGNHNFFPTAVIAGVWEVKVPEKGGREALASCGPARPQASISEFLCLSCWFLGPGAGARFLQG